MFPQRAICSHFREHRRWEANMQNARSTLKGREEFHISWLGWLSRVILAVCPVTSKNDFSSRFECFLTRRIDHVILVVCLWKCWIRYFLLRQLDSCATAKILLCHLTGRSEGCIISKFLDKVTASKDNSIRNGTYQNHRSRNTYQWHNISGRDRTLSH